ncbi:hypothetical protein MTP99_013064 [Tenebrio molitor]|nr:hypothetical protein MTP99_013064 [Tenebrio molitor]
MRNELFAVRQEVQLLPREKQGHEQMRNHLVTNCARLALLEESQRLTNVSPPLSPAPAHSQQAEPPDSEIKMEETVEPEREAPFTKVQGRYRKRPTSNPDPVAQTVNSGPSRESPSAEAPKKVKRTNPQVPQTQPTRPAPAKTVVQQKPPPESKIPPVIIRDASKWSSVSSAMTQKKIAFTKAQSCVDGIRVNPVTSDDFRALIHLLEERKVPFHSFTLPEEKTLRAVFRTVPLDDVKSDLENQGLAPIKVTRMISTRSKKPLPLILVEVLKDQKQIFQLRSVCHLLITVERPHKKGTTAQCHRCQRFHHSQQHCRAHPMCVKCGDKHDSQACKKAKTVPDNCGGAHTARYRGCPRFPRGYQRKKSSNQSQSGPQQKREIFNALWKVWNHGFALG